MANVHPEHGVHVRCPHAAHVAKSGFVARIEEFFSRMGKERTTGNAAEMAFWLFLSLLPISAVSGMLVARLALRSNGPATNPILLAMPPMAREKLTTELSSLAAWNGGTVAPLATLIFVWLASSGVHSIFDALELQSGTSRPWWRKRLVAIGACVVSSVGVVLVTLLGTGLQWLARIPGHFIEVSWMDGFGAKVARAVAGVVVSFGLVSFLYWVGLPRGTCTKSRPIVPGAIFTVIANALLGLGYGLYLRKTGTGDAYFAGLAIVGVMLTALYLFSVAMLVGALLNQILAESRGVCSAPKHALDPDRSAKAVLT